MSSASPSGQTVSLGFLTIWLLGWSLGVGFLSSLVSTEGGLLWLFIFTHGGAEIGVAWALAASFARAAEGAITPPRIEQDLAAMAARWRPTPRLLVLTVWFSLLGLLVGAILGLGTWLPVIDNASPGPIVVATLLSLGWGVIGWRWVKTLRTMLRAFESFSLSATFDRVEVTRKRGPAETVTTLPAADLLVSEEDHALTLRTPTESITVRCVPSDERAHLVQTLRDMAARARAAPFEQPPVPRDLARLRTPERP